MGKNSHLVQQAAQQSGISKIDSLTKKKPKASPKQVAPKEGTPKTAYKTNGISFDPAIYKRLRNIAISRQERMGVGRASVSKIIEELVLANIDRLEKTEGITPTK